MLKYIKRLGIPYCIWGTWYFAIGLVADKTAGASIVSTLIDKVKMLLATSQGGGMWYVQSVLIISVILYIIKKKRLNTYFTAIYFVLAILAITCDAIFELSNTFVWAKNICETYTRFFLSRLNFVFYGIYFFEGLICTKLQRKKSLRKLLCVGTLAYGGYCYFEMLGGYYVFLGHVLKLIIPVVLFLILTTMQGPENAKFTKAARSLRQTSTIIYFTHFTLVYGFRYIIKALHCSWLDWCTFSFITICGILVLYSFVFVRIDKKRIIIRFLY